MKKFSTAAAVFSASVGERLTFRQRFQFGGGLCQTMCTVMESMYF